MNKTNLQQALEQVKPGLANKEMIEQSTSFAFMSGRVVTYNDEISISHPVEGLGLEGAIKADAFYQLLSKLTEDDIGIELADNEVILKSGKVRAGLTLQQEVSLPLDEVAKIGSWKPLPEGFIDAVRFVLGSASTDMSRPELSCVHVRKDGICEASDNFRVTRVTIPKMPCKTFLFPATVARELVKYAVTHVASGEGWVHFKTVEDTVFSCRIFESTFPDIDKAGIMQVGGWLVKFPKKLPEILDRAKVFANREIANDEEVSLSITSDKKLIVEGRSDYGWFEEKANINYMGEPMAFSVHPQFLKEMLSKLRSCTIGEQAMKFEGENWEHVIWLKA